MYRDLLFPTPIYIADIEHSTLNQELERDIIAWSNRDKGVVRTNVQGWHSTTNMHELPEYAKLVDMLYSAQRTIYDQEHLRSEPYLGNMWANINPPGETHYEPKAGRLIMFPSWLMHCVDPNKSNDIRISVSFNFLQKGMMV